MQEAYLRHYHEGFALCNYCSNKSSEDFLSFQIRLLKDAKELIKKPNSTTIIEGWSRWLADFIIEAKWGIDIVVRVLAHDELELNQKQPLNLIAQKVANLIGAEYKPEIIKVRASKPQRSVVLGSGTRYYNIANTFDITEHYKGIHHKNILLIDDVFTSGATLQAIGRVLNKQGNNHHKLFDINILYIAGNGRVKYKTNIEEPHEEYLRGITLNSRLPNDILTPTFISYLGRRNRAINAEEYSFVA